MKDNSRIQRDNDGTENPPTLQDNPSTRKDSFRNDKAILEHRKTNLVTVRLQS